MIDWFRIQHNNVNISHNRKQYSLDEVLSIYHTPFDRRILSELINYFYLLVVDGELDRENVVKWILIFFKLYDYPTMSEYFRLNSLERINYRDNNVLRSWLDGIIFIMNQ
jgi:hypothetical protein